MTLNIVGHRKIYFTISAIIVGAALLAIAIFGFRQGIDFVGGTLWQFRISDSNPTVQEVERVFKEELGISEVRINYDEGNQVFLARLSEISEPEHRQFLTQLQEKFLSFGELGFQSIGPSVGKELRRNTIWAIIFVLLGISFYIAFAFRHSSRPVSSWKYGFVTLVTLFHDVAIPAGLFALLGYFGNVEIDTNFMVALLVVMGFSVHDTIVVFDRIRENLFLSRGREAFEKVVNDSVNQTIARSVNTSLTLVFVLATLYFLGPLSLRYFILTLLVGVITGTYSSIFVASPGLVLLKGKK